MQWLIKLVIASIGVPPCFIDRGDPAAADRTAFTSDGNWHNWDLSAIVPEGATAVLLRVNLNDNVSTTWLRFRKKGIVNTFNRSICRMVVANKTTALDSIVAVDSNRVIEYSATNGATFTTASVTVAGWWK